MRTSRTGSSSSSTFRSRVREALVVHDRVQDAAQFATHASGPKRSAFARAAALISRTRSGERSSSTTRRAAASTSPSATRKPSTPSLICSRGPYLMS